MPASSASSPRRAAVSGDSSLIFSTAVLPKARHGATFQVAVMKGTFHGRDQRAHADRVEQRVVQVRRRGVGVAVDARAHLGEVAEVVGRARHQLLAGLGDHLAGVVGLGAARSRARASRSARRACASAWRARARAVLAQFGKAALAAATAAFTSASPPRGDLGQHLLRGRVDGLEVVVPAGWPLMRWLMRMVQADAVRE